jgi:hypothetical protein
LEFICRGYGAFNDPKYGAIDWSAAFIEVFFSEMQKDVESQTTFFKDIEYLQLNL